MLVPTFLRTPTQSSLSSSAPAQLPCPSGFLTPSGCGFSHCVSHTVINSRVLRPQTAQLNIDCAGGRVCSQGDSALELLHTLCSTIFAVNLSICSSPCSGVCHTQCMWSVKVYPEALQDTFTEAPGFLSSAPTAPAAPGSAHLWTGDRSA